MRNRGWVLLLLLGILLAAVLLFGNIVPDGRTAEPEAQSTQEPSEALLDAMMDRIGVTRWAEALDWYEMEEAGMLPEGAAGEDTPVWVARGGDGRFHSVPVCGGLKSPVRMTLQEALAEGRLPCLVCWEA